MPELAERSSREKTLIEAAESLAKAKDLSWEVAAEDLPELAEEARIEAEEPSPEEARMEEPESAAEGENLPEEGRDGG